MLDDEAVDEEDDTSYLWCQNSWSTDDDKAKAPPKRRNRKHLPRPQKDDFYREKLNAILIYLEHSTDESSFYSHDFFLRLLACLEETRHLSSHQKEVIEKMIEELDLIY